MLCDKTGAPENLSVRCIGGAPEQIGHMFVDASFPPNDASLWGTGDRRCFEVLEWRRPQDVAGNFEETHSSTGITGDVSDVAQGLLPDCYLVAAIALLSKCPEMREQLFVAYKPEEGWCTVKLFLSGQWEEVTLDTFLPCSREGLAWRPAFAHHTSTCCFYACFIEKAFAKAHGSYAALIGGHVDEALTELTSLPVEELYLSASDAYEEIAASCEKGDLIACAFLTSVPKVKPNHTYVVLRTESSQFGKVAFFNVAEGDTFWMESPELFSCCFSICRTALVRSKSISVRLTAACAGGSANFSTFHKNPMFRVRACNPSELAITVSQPDIRLLKMPFYPQVGITALLHNANAVETDQTCCTRNRRQILMQTPFCSKRDVSLVLKVEHQTGCEYRIVTSLYFPGDLGLRQLLVRFAWHGDVTVEELHPNITTDMTFSSSFHPIARLSLPGGKLQPSRCLFKVCKAKAVSQSESQGESQSESESESEAVPVTVILYLEEDLSWWKHDPFYSSLHAIFESFGNCQTDCQSQLSESQLRALLSALLQLSDLDEPQRSKLVTKSCERTDSFGWCSFGELMSLILCLSKECDLRKAAMKLASERSSERSNESNESKVARYVAVVPLSHLQWESNEEIVASLAAGCDLPLMSNANTWSSSFLIQQKEFFLCPVIRQTSCAFQLEVQSPCQLSVQPLDVVRDGQGEAQVGTEKKLRDPQNVFMYIHIYIYEIV